MKSTGWLRILLGAATTIVAYQAWKRFRFNPRRSTHLSRRVARDLPVAKTLPTIPDALGNYDIDGVSFDYEGVIVSGDTSRFHGPTH